MLHQRHVGRGESYGPPDFLRALEYAKYLDVTDPKDKVYGLFWTLRDLDLMEADYAKSVWQIYLETSSAVINKLGVSTRSLDLLTFVNSYGRQPDLPSWVVDWSDPKPFEISSSDDFQASRITEDSRPQVIQARGMLDVFGRSVDLIKHRQRPLNRCTEMGMLPNLSPGVESRSPAPDLTEQIEGMRRWISSILDLSHGEDEPAYPTGVPRLTAFISCLIQGDVSRYHWAGSDFLRCWVQLLMMMDPQLDSQLWIEDVGFFLLTWLKQLGRSLPIGLRQAISFNRAHGQESGVPLSSQRTWDILCVLGMTSLGNTHSNTLKLNTGRAFFTTLGGYMGSAFHTIQEGDTVAVFAGARHPMIIRPVGEYYHLVGPAYIHGIMYGEAWPEDESTMQKFTLV